MLLTLDDKILAAINGGLVKNAVEDFASSPSAISKAKHVLATMEQKGFDPVKTVFISIGGADGTELEYLLTNSAARHGILLEYDDKLSESAREKSTALSRKGKSMEVLTGDALQKVVPALKLMEKWYHAGEVKSLVVSMHAVLHELPNRGSGTRDLEGFLQNFIWKNLPVLAIAREPCMPDDIPPIVYLTANCRPDNLAELSRKILHYHHDLTLELAPQPMANKVRMGSRLAIETITKLFYLDSFDYEVDERVTSFTKHEFLNAFRNVFGTENTSSEAFQTKSVDHYWKALGLQLWDESHNQLSKPELHVRITSTWQPPLSNLQNSGIEGGARSGGVSTTTNATDSTFDKKELGRIRISSNPYGVNDLDIWTPGPDKESFVRHYTSIVGEDTAGILWSASEDAILAVSQGDFSAQVEIGQRLQAIAPDNQYLLAEGYYFSAEGYRLLADIESNGAESKRLRSLAREKYNQSSAILTLDPRPVRGIGRTLEVEGDYDTALDCFIKAKGFCLARLGAIHEDTYRNDLIHELLRTTRHLIHCILDIRATNPASSWHRENKRQEMEGFLVECENYHREFMPLLKADESWWIIEWFMGLVFLARAWSQLGNSERAKVNLVYALDMRRRILRHELRLTLVEKSNLKWWLSVANDRSIGFDSSSRELISTLDDAVSAGNTALIQRIIDDFLWPLVSPLNSGSNR